MLRQGIPVASGISALTLPSGMAEDLVHVCSVAHFWATITGPLGDRHCGSQVIHRSCPGESSRGSLDFSVVLPPSLSSDPSRLMWSFLRLFHGFRLKKVLKVGPLSEPKTGPQKAHPHYGRALFAGPFLVQKTVPFLRPSWFRGSNFCWKLLA